MCRARHRRRAPRQAQELYTVTQSSDRSVIWLTQDAFEKLQQELEHLRGPARSEIIERISAAREEGDLKENGGDHPPPEEEGKGEGRIPPPPGKPPPPPGGGAPPPPGGGRARGKGTP